MKKLIYVIGALSLCFSCKTPSSTYNNSDENTASSPDSALAYVYKAWDGHWKGQFLVLNPSDGQVATTAQPQITSLEELKAIKMDTSLVIDVQQWYESTSPFYQSVRIEDRYLQNGEPTLVKSSGYNVVKGDTMLCVVNKPDEQVIHQGQHLGDGIILWGRSLKDPLKIEYFYEVATDSTYSIVGWGYYGDDNPALSPGMFFYGQYRKQ
ncbi:MAG: hypothetical protein AAFY71_28265 [Bacteroidota bacterium]